MLWNQVHACTPQDLINGYGNLKHLSYSVRLQAVQARLRALEERVAVAPGKAASHVVPDRPWAQALIFALVRLVLCVCVACEAVPRKYLFI
jgi:hypothetical protein